jgi:HK97 gp10 family phage protein
MRVDWHPDLASDEITKKAMNRLKRAAETIASKARQKVPIGRDIPAGAGKWSKRESGALKKSIRVVRLKGDPKLNIRVYAGSKEVYYARFVEYGTVKMKARPYLRPALNETKSSIIGIMESG